MLKAPQDPHVSAVIASVLGGFLWGLSRVIIIAFAPTPAPPGMVKNALAQATGSLISACIGGYYFAPVFADWLHLKDQDGRGMVYVMVGIGFWQAIPALVQISDAFMTGLVARILGVKNTKDAAP